MLNGLIEYLRDPTDDEAIIQCLLNDITELGGTCLGTLTNHALPSARPVACSLSETAYDFFPKVEMACSTHYMVRKVRTEASSPIYLLSGFLFPQV